MFSCQYFEIFKKTYFEEHLPTAASKRLAPINWLPGSYKQFVLEEKLESISQPLIFKRELHKMVKHTQTILRERPTNFLSVLDQFVRLAVKGLMFRFVSTGS